MKLPAPPKRRAGRWYALLACGLIGPVGSFVIYAREK
jgi:hypothetical protein